MPAHPALIAQNAQGMNSGLDPVTIAASLELPDALANKPYLQEYYGHIGYVSRVCFAGTLGWFDGNPTSLAQLAPAAEAVKFIDIAGGASNVLATATKALENEEWQWAMELTDRLIATDVEASKAQKSKSTCPASHGRSYRERADAKLLPAVRARAGRALDLRIIKQPNSAMQSIDAECGTRSTNTP